MNYLRVPNEITLDEIRAKGCSLSAGMYRRVVIPTNTVKRIGDLLNPNHPFDKGVEPGSLWYMKRSTHHFIRTKALQDYSYLLYPKGDAIVPINPRAFEDPELQDGDILMSKDSNVGECAIIDGNQWQQHMFSGGVVRLHPTCDRYYFFSFLKHPLFKTQLLTMLARGATIVHAKTLWLDCQIPFPNQSDADRVVRYVSALMQAIVEKEKAIREKTKLINAAIEMELDEYQQNAKFGYFYPTIQEIRSLGRLDTGMYSEDFKRKQFRITNYAHGYANYEELGFEIGRGQNLQLSNIGKSIYSDDHKPNFYRLMLPTHLTIYGTVSRYEWLGNKRPLEVLHEGDIVFGGEATFRCAVVCDALAHPTISNIHAVVLRSASAPIYRKVFVGLWLMYLGKWNYAQAIAVGGQGGSLAMGYFKHVLFPKFPDNKQAEIARLYHNPAPPPADKPMLDTFVDWHRRWNENLGIWELDREMKNLQRTLADVQEKIIAGKTVEVPI
jgi:type I restriction enzyme S subunit